MVNFHVESLTFRRILSNVGNALLRGGAKTAVFIAIYWFILPMLPPEAVPASYLNLFYIYALLAIVPTFIAYLFSGTILRYGVMTAKNLVLVVLFLTFLKEQKVSVSMPVADATVYVTLDFLIPMVMIVTIYLIDFGKSLLEAVNFLSESSEKPVEAI